MLIIIDDWIHEVTSLKGRRTKKFGAPFDAVKDVSIVNGEVHVEGLLAIGNPSRSDFSTIKKLVKRLGYSYYIKSHLEDGQRIREKVYI